MADFFAFDFSVEEDQAIDERTGALMGKKIG